MPEDRSRPRRPTTDEQEGLWQDKTQLDAGERTDLRDAVRALKLLVVAGPARGREYVLEGRELVIGRAPECTICVPDPSVSRRHLTIKPHGPLWKVTLLKSGSAAVLNGAPLEEDEVLAPGDVIGIGDSDLKVIELEGTGVETLTPVRPFRPPMGGEVEHTSIDQPRAEDSAVSTMPMMEEDIPSTMNLAPPAARAMLAAAAGLPRPTMDIAAVSPAAPARKASELPSRTKAAREASARQRKRKIFLGVSLVVSLCLIPLFIKLTLGAIEAREESDRVEAQRAVEQLFQQGKEALRVGQYAEARKAFEQVRVLDPSYPVADFIARIDRDSSTHEVLSNAIQALDENKLAKAASALREAARDSSLRDDLAKVRQMLVDKADSRVQEARGLLAKEKVGETIAILEDVLRAVPDHREAKLLYNRAVSFRQQQ